MPNVDRCLLGLTASGSLGDLTFTTRGLKIRVAKRNRNAKPPLCHSPGAGMEIAKTIAAIAATGYVGLGIVGKMIATVAAAMAKLLHDGTVAWEEPPPPPYMPPARLETKAVTYKSTVEIRWLARHWGNTAYVTVHRAMTEDAFPSLYNMTKMSWVKSEQMGIFFDRDVRPGTYYYHFQLVDLWGRTETYVHKVTVKQPRKKR